MWRDYLTVRLLHKHAAYLPRQVDGTDFAFYGTVLSGQKQPLPRDLRAIRMLDQEIGRGPGQALLRRLLPARGQGAQPHADANLMRAYEDDIQSLAWMTPATREKALEKLHSFLLKIGYPDTWRDYSALAIRAANWSLTSTVRRPSTGTASSPGSMPPVDRSEWGMTPRPTTPTTTRA